MRSGGALAPIVMLTVQPLCVFGRNYGFPPDPLGEKLYGAHLFVTLTPIPLILCGIWLAWSLLEARRKARNVPSDEAGSYEI